MSNIINIKSAPTKRGLTVRKAEFCPHNGLMYTDEKFRVLECERCGAIIDPFDYLMKIARDNDMYWNMKQEYRKQATELAAKVEELKREERNLKARIKRKANPKQETQ